MDNRKEGPDDWDQGKDANRTPEWLYSRRLSEWQDLARKPPQMRMQPYVLEGVSHGERKFSMFGVTGGLMVKNGRDLMQAHLLDRPIAQRLGHATTLIVGDRLIADAARVGVNMPRMLAENASDIRSFMVLSDEICRVAESDLHVQRDVVTAARDMMLGSGTHYRGMQVTCRTPRVRYARDPKSLDGVPSYDYLSTGTAVRLAGDSVGVRKYQEVVPMHRFGQMTPRMQVTAAFVSIAATAVSRAVVDAGVDPREYFFLNQES